VENLKEKLISVIITCYNNELYIEKCIKSIIDSNNKNIEIILINDGSTDNSLNIINQYKDNIKIITTENRGLSNSRNRGIEESTGKYILFIDGDDYIDSSAINKIEEFVDTSDFDLLLLNTTKYYEEKNIFEKEKLSFKKNVLDLKDLIEYKICGRAWRFLYKRKLIQNNNLKFRSNVIFEDEEWVPKVIYYSSIIKFLDIDYYYYRKRKNSITTSKNFNNINDLMKIINNTYEWNKCIMWNSSYIYFSLSRCIKNVLSSLYYLNDEDKSKVIVWYNENKSMIFDILKCNKRFFLSIKLFGPSKGIKIYKKIFKEKNKIKKILIKN